MTAYRMPSCLEREISLQDGEFPVRYEPLQNSMGRIIGIHFIDELHMPYENLGFSSKIVVAWRGQATEIDAPLAIDSETGLPCRTPFTYAAPYAERVAAAVAGISRLEADYQRQLNELDRSR